MIQKWVTWVIPTKILEEKTPDEMDKLMEQLESEMSRTLTDIAEGIPISYKVTNMKRRYEE